MNADETTTADIAHAAILRDITRLDVHAIGRQVPFLAAATAITAAIQEKFDGSGFPNRIAGERIPRLARIAAIANRYDNLCNPFDLRDAKAPAEALRQIFRNESARYDAHMVQLFIKTLGVFPPGTFVSLSNGSVGMVVETNPSDLLHPLVMLYDPVIPRTEAMLLDLRDELPQQLVDGGVRQRALVDEERVRVLAVLAATATHAAASDLDLQPRIDVLRDRQIGIQLERVPRRGLRQFVLFLRVAGVLTEEQMHAREARPGRRVARVFIDRAQVQIARDRPPLG